MPSFSAAPAMTPLASRRAPRMSSLSEASNVWTLVLGALGRLPLRSTSDTFRREPWERISARSITFSNSRTLPGQRRTCALVISARARARQQLWWPRRNSLLASRQSCRVAVGQTLPEHSYDRCDLRREARAWGRRMNRDRVTIDWRFTRKQARLKFGYRRNQIM